MISILSKYDSSVEEAVFSARQKTNPRGCEVKTIFHAPFIGNKVWDNINDGNIQPNWDCFM